MKMIPPAGHWGEWKQSVNRTIESLVFEPALKENQPLERLDYPRSPHNKRRMPGGGLPFRNTFYDSPAVLSPPFTHDLVARTTPRRTPRGRSTS